MQLRFLAFLGLLVSSFALAADTDVFLIHPYLFTVQGKQIGVGWQYQDGAAPAKAALTLFKGGAKIGELAADDDRGVHHVLLPIASCGFGGDVGYQVTGQSAKTAITGIPCADSASGNTARFSFLADTQEGPEIAHLFATALAGYPGQASLIAGDLVQTGDDYDAWVQYFQAMDPIGGQRVLVPAVGNHEYRDDAEIPLWKRFFTTPASEAHYSFAIGEARVLVLNSCFEDDASQIEPEVQWITHELQQKSRWTIVMFHHPAYSVGFFNSFLAPRKEHEVIAERFVPLFESMGVDLVLNGHTHIFERSIKSGIQYLTAGPGGGKMGIGGASNEYSVIHAYERSVTHIEVSPNALRATSLDQDGKQLDDVTLSKHDM